MEPSTPKGEDIAHCWHSIAPAAATAISADVAVKHSARANEWIDSGINSGANGRFRRSDFRATPHPESVV